MGRERHFIPLKRYEEELTAIFHQKKRAFMCPKVVNIYVHVEELISRLVQLTRKKQTEKVFYLLRLGFSKVSKEFPDIPAIWTFLPEF